MTIFASLESLRHKPLPDLATDRARRAGFRARIAIDAAHPAHGEGLTDAREAGLAGENYYHASRNPPYWGRVAGSVPQLWLRAGVIARLRAVNARAAEAGLELFLFDGWRPRAIQAYFHDVWMPAEIARRQPHLAGDALIEEVERYWAAPSNGASPAPHATGGAVDLTLRWKDGEHLWMGSLFDDVTAMANRDRFENLPHADMSFSNEEARANRRLLHWLMLEQDFAPHPEEWWHFSWGDQMWAALTEAPAAFYGEARPPG